MSAAYVAQGFKSDGHQSGLLYRATMTWAVPDQEGHVRTPFFSNYDSGVNPESGDCK